MAQGLLRHLLDKAGRTDVQVISAGVGTSGGSGATQETIDVMKQEGIDVSGHVGRPATRDLILHADLVLCMEDFQRDQVVGLAPEARLKVHLLRTFQAKGSISDPNIPDPIGKPKEVYESCLLTIKDSVQRLYRWLEKQPA